MRTLRVDGVKLGFLRIFKEHHCGGNHLLSDLLFSPLGSSDLSLKSEAVGLIVPSGPFQFYGSFYKRPFGATVSDTSCQQDPSCSLMNREI